MTTLACDRRTVAAVGRARLHAVAFTAGNHRKRVHLRVRRGRRAHDGRAEEDRRDDGGNSGISHGPQNNIRARRLIHRPAREIGRVVVGRSSLVVRVVGR